MADASRCAECFSCTGTGSWNDLYHRKCVESVCVEQCDFCLSNTGLVIHRPCASGQCKGAPMCHWCALDEEMQQLECTQCARDDMGSSARDDGTFQMVQNMMDDGFAPSGQRQRAQTDTHSTVRQQVTAACLAVTTLVRERRVRGTTHVHDSAVDAARVRCGQREQAQSQSAPVVAAVGLSYRNDVFSARACGLSRAQHLAS